MPLKQARGWTLQATVRFPEPEWPVTGGLSVSEGSLAGALATFERASLLIDGS